MLINVVSQMLVGYDNMAYRDYIDINVHCLRKAIKLNHLLHHAQ